jgi:ATP-dependent Lhr-like helicase
MSADLFHPAVAAWFARRFGEPTEPQRLAWPAIRSGRHALIAAPTGSGKTLAAFLAAIDELWRAGLAGALGDETRVVYVSPLKALSNDIQKNLAEPLAGIAAEAAALGLEPVAIRTLVRTGDTPAAERAAMTRRPPHILVTTPESLYILLTSEGGRRLLRTARAAIVDEIHAVADDKRGSHLALSLERLAELCASTGRPLQRIGLSATQRPVEEVARFLVGAANVAADGAPDCAVVDTGHRRRLDLSLEVPGSPLEAVMSAEVWEEVYDRLAQLASEQRTTLVFVNTRRLAERVARHLADRLGEDAVAAHHGSLARERRLRAEQRLKAGELRVLVATASLELGIDIGTVDLVCQVGSTRSIAVLLQRVGRSGHRLGAVPKGRIFPTSRDELVECAALLDAVRRGELEALVVPRQPLDILAQQLVAEVAARDSSEDELFALARRAWPYRGLERADFDAVVTMLADGFSTRRGRRAAHLHRDEVHGRLRARRGARLAAITSGGAIPDTGDFRVVEEPTAAFVGTVNEDFAIESQPGDVFQLGNFAWKIRKIEPGRVLVEDARGAPPSLPFWLGEAPGRSPELSAAVARLRRDLGERLAGTAGESERHDLARTLGGELGLAGAAARQLVEYLAAAQAALQAMPTQETLVLERFFDEAGDMHLVLHAPFGSRLNRAWGLALRKRFCRAFNFELQAAATEDAILLSLGPTHSFPLEEVFRFLHSASVRQVLVQALLDAPMFGVRWRWNAARALALLRFRGGKRVPPRLQRQEADDLSAIVFPDHLACPENLPGERTLPDHPLVAQTVGDCLTEAMDIEGLETLLRSLEGGELELVARELTEPSPLAHEAVNARVYAFLDDAPLEERRTLAVQARRFLSPEDAAGLGALDREAIARVRAEAWPVAETPDELHDALVLSGFLTAAEGRAGGWQGLFAALAGERRAAVARTASGAELWIAAERLPEVRAVHPGLALDPAIVAPARRERAVEGEAALVELLRGRLEICGPLEEAALAAAAGVSAGAVQAALAALEREGFALRGRFTPGAPRPEVTEWCERRLLARIHRLTLDRLRREIEPVAPVDFLRFLAAWQRAAPADQAAGPEGLAAVLDQLEGFEAPAAAWEGEILPSRLKQYDPVWLDALCLSGRYVWRRLTPPQDGGRRGGPVRSTPIALVRRESVALGTGSPAATLTATANATAGVPVPASLSANARAVVDWLDRRGASFFADIAAGAGLLHTQAEEALAELVAQGRATSDSFTGLRALLVPQSRRAPVPGAGHPGAGQPGAGQRGAGHPGARRRNVAVFGMENAGRWSLLPAPAPLAGDLPAECSETLARVLLRRYGVVFRRLLERESRLPPWRELLSVYRRLEARGEVRGGRFVDGFSGEQYALPEAVGRLRALRRRPGESGRDDLLAVSAADPLNLVGILTPGERLAALAANRVLFRDGVPLAVLEAGKTRFLLDLADPEPQASALRWQARSALLRRSVPPALRPYLGRTA